MCILCVADSYIANLLPLWPWQLEIHSVISAFVAPPGAWTANMMNLGIPVLIQFLQLWPIVSIFFDVSFYESWHHAFRGRPLFPFRRLGSRLSLNTDST